MTMGQMLFIFYFIVLAICAGILYLNIMGV
jgi:hypothetical protein